MSYRIELTATARRALRNLTDDIQARIRGALDGLAENPRPHGVKKLKGLENEYRIRVGDYRVIYQIFDGRLLVLVVDIDHRRDVYR